MFPGSLAYPGNKAGRGIVRALGKRKSGFQNALAVKQIKCITREYAILKQILFLFY